MLNPQRIFLYVWSVVILVWWLFPIGLVDPLYTSTAIVGLMLTLCIFLFSLRSVKPISIDRTRHYLQDNRHSQRILSFVSIVAAVALLIDLYLSGNVTLKEAYLNRSQQGQNVLEGAASNSSLFFKIAFLTYPAGYIYLVSAIIFSEKIVWLRVALFGIAPIVLASFVLGGRVQLLIGFILLVLSFRVRNHNGSGTKSKNPRKIRQIIKTIVLTFLILSMTLYFSNVFITRAEVAGGTEIMLEVGKDVWGITFKPGVQEAWINILGVDLTFLIFVFWWYFVQGLIMNLIIFSKYTVAPLYGVYGLELVSATLRRFNGSAVSEGFQELMNIGVYGFLPGAFGSLYVDIKWLYILVVVLWARWCSKVYYKARVGFPKSKMLYPFMAAGLLFSFINTPLGLSNGMMLYFWLFVSNKYLKVYELQN